MSDVLPWLSAFVTIGPASALAGFLIRPFITGGKSSPPSLTLTDDQKKELAMAVFAELEQPLADLAAAVTALPDNVATAVNAGGAAAAQDKADTIAAVVPALQAATDAMNDVAPPAAPAPVEG